MHTDPDQRIKVGAQDDLNLESTATTIARLEYERAGKHAAEIARDKAAAQSKQAERARERAQYTEISEQHRRDYDESSFANDARRRRGGKSRKQKKSKRRQSKRARRTKRRR